MLFALQSLFGRAVSNCLALCEPTRAKSLGLKLGLENRLNFATYFYSSVFAYISMDRELSTGSQVFDDNGRDSDVSGKDMAINGCCRLSYHCILIGQERISNNCERQVETDSLLAETRLRGYGVHSIGV
jgi:hypothetical protein